MTADSASLEWAEVSGATRHRVEWRALDREGVAGEVDHVHGHGFVVSDLSAGSEYEFRVWPGTDECLALEPWVVRGRPLGAVSSVAVTRVAGDSLVLEWASVEGAAGYRVERRLV